MKAAARPPRVNTQKNLRLDAPLMRGDSEQASASAVRLAAPPGSLPELSGIDRRELRILAEEMDAANLPGLMLIVADRNRHQFFIR
jgi:hypothetical protein